MTLEAIFVHDNIFSLEINSFKEIPIIDDDEQEEREKLFIKSSQIFFFLQSYQNIHGHIL